MEKKKMIVILGLCAIVLLPIIVVNVFANKKYTVIFNTNGGISINSQILKKGEKVKEPNNPTKEGYIFKEWQLDNKTFDFESEVTSNITLDALWEKEIINYTVSFNTDGGNEIENQLVKEGDKVVKPSNPIKEGYVFKEWQLNDNTYDFNNKVMNNIDLKAIYEKVESYYTVTFNTDGGTTIQKQTIKAGDKVVKPSNPTKTGYIFKEWQLNNKTYNFDAKVTENVELKAKWENEYTKYRIDAYTLSCYTGTTVDLANNVENGTIITCYVHYELDVNDKVSNLQYDLRYGKGLKITKKENLENAKESNGNYVFTFKDPSDNGMCGKFIFEVTDDTKTSELYVGIENFKFKTSKNKYYKDSNIKQAITSVWDKMNSQAVPYIRNDAISFTCFDSNKQNIIAVKKGDQITCGVSYEVNGGDEVLKFQYDIKFGKSLKLIKSSWLDGVIINGSNYKKTLKNQWVFIMEGDLFLK